MMGAFNKRILTRLIIMSIIVLSIMNCEESNPSESVDKNDTVPDVSLYNNWILVSLAASSDEGVNFVEYNYDSTIYKIEETDSLSYYCKDVSNLFYKKYELIKTDADSLNLPNFKALGFPCQYYINGNTLITKFEDGMNPVIWRMKFIKYDGVIPPETWNVE